MKLLGSILGVFVLSLVVRECSSVFHEDNIVFPKDVTSPFQNKLARGNLELKKRYEMAVAAVFGIAVRLKLLADDGPTENFVVSPISVASAIGELILGTDGESRSRLEYLLSAGYNTSERPLELHRQLGELLQLLYGTAGSGYQLETASAFFLQPGLKLLTTYEHAVKTLYGVDLVSLDFSGDPVNAQNMVNEWVYRHTHGYITTLLPTPISPKTSSLLATTVYFHGDWEMPFDPELTVPGTFRSIHNRRIRVEYMRGIFDLLHARGGILLGYDLLVLPYKGSEAALYLLLPHPGENVHEIVAQIKMDELKNLIDSATTKRVALVMPKSTVSHTLSIREVLANQQAREALHQRQRYRPERRFRRREFLCRMRKQRYDTRNDSLNLNMTGASSDPRFRVDDVLHQVVMEITETGTVGAAVSTGTVDYILDATSFKVNRPYIFFIRHEATLTPLFWGIIVDPTDGMEY